MTLRFALALLATLALALPATAQGTRAKRKKTEAEAPAAPPPAPVIDPHHRPLIALSQMIGALSRLSELCMPDQTPNPWRVRMETFVSAEGEGSGIADTLRGAFNQSYSEYATSYRSCTPAAKAAIDILTRDAARQARDIERRFGS